jgi:SlyX protein
VNDAKRIELETRLTFQEDTIAKLNDALVDQQRQLDQLRAVIARLVELIERSAPDPSYSVDEERPPHY